ncbi:metallophosphoesterase [Schlesneria paludicola]|uniref:metallophosphoesterase n=1 Tax=Schlesneria paludicola TaxID=360056 RepID=UPI00029A3F09|nr:metallophosphoesterase [Schlesneria paludicola]
MYDLIGDIHGHADALVQLLQLLGYQSHEGIYRHPERKVIFLGDFIDRGPQIQKVLKIVQQMVAAGTAYAVMGNHELNAIAYHTEDRNAPGEFLRRHSPSNNHQHRQTVEQLTPDELKFYLEWFRTLPMWLELEGLRAVHACWDDRAIARVRQDHPNDQPLLPSFLQSACRPGNELFDAVETLLKGKEAPLPGMAFFRDKEGHVRRNVRVRWYLSPERHTIRSYAMTDEIESDHQLDEASIAAAVPYPSDAPPVFCGHYWLAPIRPEILAPNVACLDFSVAKGGFLCAYRWQGEHRLANEHFVWTNQPGNDDAIPNV